MKEAWTKSFPTINSNRVSLAGADLLPKPELGDIPVLVTGHSGQSLEWIAKESDGWITYPRNSAQQEGLIREWRSLTDGLCNLR